jgi:hypothetical protein
VHGQQQALRVSEDSSKLNTSFIERLNLTVQQGSDIWVAEQRVTPGGRNPLRITWSCFAVTAIS